MFFDEKSQQAFPAIIYCRSISAHAIENHRRETRLPRIVNFRKCCPWKSVYDVERKFCVPSSVDDDVTLVFGRLNVDMLDVYSGPPTCEYALVDYKLEARDVYGDDAAGGGISFQIAIPRNGQRRNTTIDVDNGCWDVDASSSFIAVRICSAADYCLGNPCIRKCCAGNKINIKCQDTAGNGSLENLSAALSSAMANSSALPVFDIKRYGLLYGIPCKLYYSGEPNEPWTIGSLGEISSPGYPIFNYVNSCLEFSHDDPTMENGFHPFYCFGDDEQLYASNPRFEIAGGLAFLSSFFLLITLLVYICLPTLQNLHGKTLMSHVLSLFFAYLSLGFVDISTRAVLDDVDYVTADYICKYLGFLMMFSFHSAFFWLNVMCFDIWWTFGGMQGPSSAATKRRQQKNRFLIYCAYAWGLAFVLTCLAAIFEQAGLVESSIGRERCWFESHSNGEVIFFMIPTSLTLLANIVFFAITSYRCSKVKAEIKRAMANVKDPTARKFHSDKTRLIMNLKLFVVMGMPWILETAPALLGHYVEMPSWLLEALYFADVINSLQGLWIFILFVLKPKVYRALRKRYAAAAQPKASNNALDVQGLHPVRKSASNTTLTSNFLVSSTTT